MKKFRKCFSALFLSCFLAFGNISGCYLEVQAFEWVVPALTIEEVLPWLLGLLGVTIGGKVVGDTVDWDTLKQDCITFQENQGNSAVAVSEWWNDVLSGSLNQASECWVSFKEWVTSLTSFSSDSSVVNGGTFLVNNISYDISAFSKYLGSYTISDPSYSGIGVYNGYLTGSRNYNGSNRLGYFLIASSNINDIPSQAVSFLTRQEFTYEGSTVYYIVSYRNTYYDISPKIDDFVLNSNATISSTLDSSLLGLLAWLSVFGSVESGNSDYNITSYDNNLINDLSLALQNAISSAIPDVIPLPWENVGEDVSAINDKMDKLLEQVSAGTLSIDAFMEAVQSLLGVLSVDTSADGVLIPEKPNPDTDEPEKLEDEVAKNKSNSGFVLGGLEKVFPFCIPFDLYAFMTLLVAEPVAPVIEWPVYNPITDNNEIITIDFSTWESVVVLLRYIFDFLFIIGLLLMARALIGGGDSA